MSALEYIANRTKITKKERILNFLLFIVKISKTNFLSLKILFSLIINSNPSTTSSRRIISVSRVTMKFSPVVTRSMSQQHFPYFLSSLEHFLFSYSDHFFITLPHYGDNIQYHRLILNL
jgi:hypothetical protein